MAHLKRGNLEVVAEQNCVAHALVNAVAKVQYDRDYTVYRGGR